MFKTIKRLKGTKSQKSTLCRGGKFINSPEEKAEWLKQHLEETFKKKILQKDKEEEINGTLEEQASSDGIILERGNDARNLKKEPQLATTEEVAEIQKGLNNRRTVQLHP